MNKNSLRVVDTTVIPPPCWTTTGVSRRHLARQIQYSTIMTTKAVIPNESPIIAFSVLKLKTFRLYYCLYYLHFHFQRRHHKHHSTVAFIINIISSTLPLEIINTKEIQTRGLLTLKLCPQAEDYCLNDNVKKMAEWQCWKWPLLHE